MKTEDLWLRLALGAAAGLAGTMAIQALLKAHEKVSPATMPPIKEHPGRFMLRKAKQSLPRKVRRRVPRKVENAGANLLGMGYGITFGALYAVTRPKTRWTLLEGTLLGVIAWAAGYLGWLPLAKLMPPVWKQKPTQAIIPVAEHAAFGVATVAGYGWLKRRAHI